MGCRAARIANSLPRTGQQLDFFFFFREGSAHLTAAQNMSWGMGGQAGKIAVHCQAEIALEIGAWEHARWDLQAQLCKVKKEAIFCRAGKATEETSGVQRDLLSSELIPTVWREKKKLQ